MIVCPVCGNDNPVGARFCSQCGQKLTALAPEEPVDATATISLGDGRTETSDRLLAPVDAAAVDALPVGHALLVVQKGPGSGSRFLLDKDVVRVGRDPDSDIFLDDITVSRKHLLFRRSGDTFQVEELGSLNGTYVNRDRIERAVLKDGDEVQIGKFRLVFYAGHAG